MAKARVSRLGSSIDEMAFSTPLHALAATAVPSVVAPTGHDRPWGQGVGVGELVFEVAPAAALAGAQGWDRHSADGVVLD